MQGQSLYDQQQMHLMLQQQQQAQQAQQQVNKTSAQYLQRRTRRLFLRVNSALSRAALRQPA